MDDAQAVIDFFLDLERLRVEGAGLGIIALQQVYVGEPSVVVAVSSAHRGDAFDSARFIIDELKKRAPIWKKEHWPGGAEWVEGA